MDSGKILINAVSTATEKSFMTVELMLELLEKWLKEKRENECAKIIAEHIANGKDIDFRVVNMTSYEKVKNSLMNPSKHLSPDILKREYGENYKDLEIRGSLPPIPFMLLVDKGTNTLVVVTREEDRGLVDELVQESLRITPRVAETKLNEINKKGRILEFPSLSADEHKAFTTAAQKYNLPYSESRNDDGETFSIKVSASLDEDIVKVRNCIKDSVLNTVGYSATQYFDFHDSEEIKEILKKAAGGKEEFCIVNATRPDDYIKVKKDGIYIAQKGKDEFIQRNSSNFNRALYNKVENMNIPVIGTETDVSDWNGEKLLAQAIRDHKVDLTSKETHTAEIERYARTMYDLKYAFDSAFLEKNASKLESGEMSLKEYLSCDYFLEEGWESKEELKVFACCSYFINNEMTPEDENSLCKFVNEINKNIDLMKDASLVHYATEQTKTMKEILNDMDKTIDRGSDKVLVNEKTEQTITETTITKKEEME